MFRMDKFYQQLDKVIKAVPKKGLYDWNAKVIGQKQWVHLALAKPSAGLILLEFAHSHRLTSTSTLHPQRKWQFGTHQTNLSTTKKSRDGGRFATLNLMECDVDTENITEMLLRAIAQEVLEHQKKKKQPWDTNDICHLCEQVRSTEDLSH